MDARNAVPDAIVDRFTPALSNVHTSRMTANKDKTQTQPQVMTYMRYNCPHCKQHFEIPLELLGTLIDCPSCQTEIQLPNTSESDGVESATTQPAFHEEKQQSDSIITKLRSLITSIFQIAPVYKIIAAISLVALVAFLLVVVLRPPPIRCDKNIQWRESGLVPYDVNAQSPYSGIVISYRGDSPQNCKRIVYTDDLLFIVQRQLHFPSSDN